MTFEELEAQLRVACGKDLEQAVADVARTLGLQARTQVRVARRLWGAERPHRPRAAASRLGPEPGHRVQVPGHGRLGGRKRSPATIQDIAAWPIPGIVVFEGAGFSANMRAYLHSTGKAVAYEDLAGWLTLFFGLPDAAGTTTPAAQRTLGEADRGRQAPGD